MSRAFLKQWFPWCVYGIVFLLPWQTRYIYDQATIGGAPFEYGTMSVYVVELMIALVFFFGQRLQIRREHQTSVKAMGIVLLASAASIVFSRNTNLSLGAWSHLMFGGMLFTVLLDQRVDRFKTLLAFVLGLIPPAVLGLVQVVTGSSPAFKWLGLAAHHASDLGVAVVMTEGERMLRAYGSFTHPNVFGGFLAVGLLCVIFLIIHACSRRAQILFSFLLFFLTLSLVATFSRSAWLAFVFAIGVGIFFLIRKHRSKIRPLVPLFLLLFFSFFLSFSLFLQPMMNRFDSSQHLEQISVQDRLRQYTVYPGLVKQDFVLGAGIGAYTVALSELKPSLPVWEYQPIHNVPLLVVGEIGLLGGIALLFWASAVDRCNYAAIRKGSLGAVGGIMLGSIPLVIIFFDHYLWSNWAGLALLMFLMAMTLRLSED